MRFIREGLQNYFAKNRDFNHLVQHAVGEIFQTQSMGPISYVPCREASANLARRFVSSDVVERAQISPLDPRPGQQERFSISHLGSYEKVIFSCLAWGQYSTYVLLGEMGSGKSTTARLVLKALEDDRKLRCGLCERCSPIILQIDFNQGFNAQSPDKAVKSFRTVLRSRLRAELRKLFKVEGLVDGFLHFVQESNNINDFSIFDDFAQACEEDLSWKSRTKASKANALFRHVESEEIGDELERIMLLARFVKSAVRPDPACFILLIDNLDSVSPEAQFEILVDVLAYQEIGKLKALVPLRRSTFERLPNRSAYSFGIINHAGPRPTEIVSARISHFLEHWSDYPYLTTLAPAHSDALKRRLIYLLGELTRHHPVMERVFFLSGASIRLALFLFERVIINSVIEFDSDPHYRDETMRAALHGDNPRPDVSNTDRFFANLLFDPDAMTGVSLILVRILQFVAEFENYPDFRRVRNLVTILRAVNPEWRSRKVLRALNYLLNEKRPLLWVDGKASYKDVREMLDADDTVFLTESGNLYLRLLGDLQYFQEVTAGVSWPGESDLPSSVNYSFMPHRFVVIRKCAQILREIDEQETRRFKAWLAGRDDFPDINLRLVSTRFIVSLSEVALAILRGGRRKEHRDELRNWLSFLLAAFNSEAAILERENGSLDRARAALERELAERPLS